MKRWIAEVWGMVAGIRLNGAQPRLASVGHCTLLSPLAIMHIYVHDANYTQERADKVLEPRRKFESISIGHPLSSKLLTSLIQGDVRS